MNLERAISKLDMIVSTSAFDYGYEWARKELKEILDFLRCLARMIS